MKCDQCRYVFKLDGTENCITSQTFSGAMAHFCSSDCFHKYHDEEKKEEEKHE